MDLQSRVDASRLTDSERIASLELENSKLRAHITRVQSQLEGAQTTLQLMTRSCSSLLGQNEGRESQDPESGGPTEEQEKEPFQRRRWAEVEHHHRNVAHPRHLDWPMTYLVLSIRATSPHLGCR